VNYQHQAAGILATAEFTVKSPELAKLIGAPMPMPITGESLGATDQAAAHDSAVDLMAEIGGVLAEHRQLMRRSHRALVVLVRQALIAFYERVKGNEQWPPALRDVVDRFTIWLSPDGRCLFTGRRILIPGPVPKRLKGAIVLDHDKTGKATFWNAVAMYYRYNIGLFRRGRTPADYEAKVGHWRERQQYWYEHVASPADRGLIDYYDAVARKEEEWMQRWEQDRRRIQREEYGEGE
jgi:hypothetical protein